MSQIQQKQLEPAKKDFSPHKIIRSRLENGYSVIENVLPVTKTLETG